MATKTTKSPKASIFVLAASLLNSSKSEKPSWPNQWACNAIGAAVLGTMPTKGTYEGHPRLGAYLKKRSALPETKFFGAAFRPSEEDINNYLIRGDWEEMGWYGDHCPVNREARILGLLLAAELVKDGFTAEDFA